MFVGKKNKRKKPLMNYIQSRVVVSNEYLNILQHKASNKEATKTIREQRSKEEDNHSRCLQDNSFNIIEQIIQHHIHNQ
jgi:hypothetical protein